MTLKENVLLKLIECKKSGNDKKPEANGSFISGTQMALFFNVSREAVSKAVNSLIEEGYKINAVSGKGYCLISLSDSITKEGIRCSLYSKYSDMPLFVYKQTDSTNKRALEAAMVQDFGRDSSIALYAAEKQTNGRGRLGRSFETFPGKNIYMSVVVSPKASAEDTVMITTAASVAVLRAVKKVCGIDLDIKWVNDLYYKKHKICGILTQAVTDCEGGRIEHVVVGIGINYYVPENEIPDELKEKAAALYYSQEKDMPVRDILIAQVTNELLEISENADTNSFIEDYRKHSMILGKKVNVISEGREKMAVAEAIDEHGWLKVRYDDGGCETLSTGEVTIRTV